MFKKLNWLKCDIELTKRADGSMILREVRWVKSDAEMAVLAESARIAAVGLKRAADLGAGRAVSLVTVRRMWAFFNRHSANYEKISDKASKWYQAWLGWGGNAALRWVYSILRKLGLIRDVAPTVARILNLKGV